MQTTELLSTIRWIRSLFDANLERYVFYRLEDDMPETVLNFSHRLGRVSYVLSQNKRAVAVLTAFGLETLLSDKLAGFCYERKNRPTRERERSEREQAGHEHLSESERLDDFGDRWRVMTQCAEPLGALTMPPELLDPVPPDSILTLEIRRPEPETPPIACLSTASSQIEALYLLVARAYGVSDAGMLSIVKVESGSGISISCKGLGDVVKHVKDLLLEAWHKLRHKRAEEVIEKNKAVLTSLAVIAHINRQEQAEALGREDAERLRRDIVDSTCALLECGALIADIAEEEVVYNDRLLAAGFVPKQLPAPSGPEDGDGNGAKRRGSGKKKGAPKSAGGAQNKN